MQKKRMCLALPLLLAVTACGGGSSPVASDPPPPPPVPSASLTATGGGQLVLHPSVDRRFSVAMETPIRIVESAGGSATWNFARLSLMRAGREIERAELGSDVIAAAGFSHIGARSNQVVRVFFRFNSDNFDDVLITLGFADVKDGRQFTATAALSSFSDVSVSVTPVSVLRSPVRL